MDQQEYLEIAQALQSMHEGLGLLIEAASQKKNYAVVSLLGALQNHADYIRDSLAAAAKLLADQKPERHPLDIWKKDANN